MLHSNTRLGLQFGTVVPSMTSALMVLTFISLFSSTVLAQFNFWGRSVDADSKKTYTLTEENGPWTIMAYTFTGESAEGYAHKLCLELRKDHKVEAYVYHKQIKQEDRVVGRGFYNENGEINYMKHLNDPNVNAYIVFVGDYSSVEDSRAAQTLQKLRKIQPNCLKYYGNFAHENPLSQESMQFNASHGYGQLGRAFLTQNPIIAEKAQKNQMAQGDSIVDAKVVGYNKNVKNCLLECPGKYSVQIATFRGFRTSNQSEIKSIQETGEIEIKKNSTTLAAADENAQKLTAYLRKQGVEAYCFKDHYASIVTVGSFNEISYVNPQTGKQEAIPQIQQIFKQYGATQDPKYGMGRESIRLRVINGIAIDATPFVINVPRAPKNARSFAGKLY